MRQVKLYDQRQMNSDGWNFDSAGMRSIVASSSLPFCGDSSFDGIATVGERIDSGEKRKKAGSSGAG